MIKVSPQQAQIRLKTLPEEIKNEIFSEEGTDIILSIGQKNNLTPEKSSDLDLLVGYVLSGFIYQGDLEKEIEFSLHIPHQSAIDIGRIVREKVLSKHKDVLEKIYKAPEEIPARSNVLSPVSMPLNAEKKEVKLPVNGVPKPVSIPPPVSKPVPPAPKTPIPPPPSASPFIIHQKNEVKPVVPSPNFRLGGIPRPTAANVPMPQPSSRPARVELGVKNIPAVPTPKAAQNPSPTREPVHYSEPKSAFIPPVIPPQTPVAPPNPAPKPAPIESTKP